MKSIEEFRPQLEAIMKGIVKEFGENCEAVLHDHSKGLDHSIVAIENGHVTGRKVGDSSTNLGFEILKNNVCEDQYGYITRLPSGKTLKSSSVYFKDDDGKVLGSLCINFDITKFLAAADGIGNLLTVQDHKIKEHFGNNVGDILDNLIAEYFDQTPLDPKNMDKAQICAFLAFLDQKGAFLIRNSVPKICSLLEISKYTFYAYLKEINAGRE